jgi:hypothetical protein
VASSLVVEVKERAGVDGDQVREYLDRLGYKSTGQVLPLANQLYRRPWGPSGGALASLSSSRCPSGSRKKQRTSQA